MTALLSLTGVDCRFGGVTALADVDLDITEGETMGLIGPNGAGKSTLLNCATGYYRPSRGQITVEGCRVRPSPRTLCRLGVARTFQNLALFEPQTVRENVVFGGYLRATGRTGLRGGRRAVRDKVEQILTDLDLDDVVDHVVSDLPYPVRKRIEFARALMARPRLILLDEPTSGMGVEDSRDFATMLDRARKQWDLTLGIVAHDMAFVFRTCDVVHVLDAGRVVFRGTPEEVREDANVRHIYLGGRG